MEKNTSYRKVKEELVDLNKTERKVYNLIHSELNYIFTVSEISRLIKLDRKYITFILNKLEDTNRLPEWVERARGKMKLKLLKRTPEQVRIDKELIKANKKARKEADQFDKELQKLFTGSDREWEKETLSVEWYKVPETVESVFMHWYNKTQLAKTRLPVKSPLNGYMDPSKTFKKVILTIKRLIAGTMYDKNEFVRRNRKFTVEEIKLSIDRFHLAATSDRHYPLKKESLRRMNINDFFYCPYYKDDKYRSQFLYYLDNEPAQRVEIVEEAPPEKMPSLTRKLLTETKERLEFDITDWKTINSIVVTANKLYDFWVENEKKNLWAVEIAVNGMVREFVSASISWAERKVGRGINPQTFNQPWFIDSVFRNYLERQGLLLWDYEEEVVYTEPDEAFKMPLTGEGDEDPEDGASIFGAKAEIFSWDRFSDEPESKTIPINKEMSEKERARYENAPD